MNAFAIVFAASFLPFFEAKNTAANYILVPPEEGAPEIRAEKPPLSARENCPACGGSGKLQLSEPDYGQYGGRIGTPNKKKTVECRFCGGRGKIETYKDPSQAAAQAAADREKFESAHLSKGEIPVGSAFVPRTVYDVLEKDDTSTGRKQRKEKLKLVESAYGEPCRTCNWTGIEPCPKCAGKGWSVCKAKDCKEGWRVEKTTSKTTKRSSGGNSLGGSWRSSGSRSYTKVSEKTSVSVCPECGGAAKTPCPECGGKRGRPCRKCNGLGTKKKGY